MYNKNSGYGMGVIASAPFTTGKVFAVAAAGVNYNRLSGIFTPDPDGTLRIYTTPALALAQCVAGRGDVVILDPSYTTAPSAAELLAAETKGVHIQGVYNLATGKSFAYKPTAALPASTTGSLFTVTGDVLLHSIIGVVTTVIQTQACNTKLAVKKGATSTDICAVLNISANAVGSRYSITGTYGNALINTAIGVPLAPQATPVFIEGGSTIDLNTAATNTGSVKWAVKYEAQAPGAQIISA
jgi:hypothetical protein